MAAMKLYYGSDLVGGEVDLAEFDQLKTDVAGKYDKGDPTGLDGGVMEYDNAALMEAAVKGNTAEIDTLNQKLDDWLTNDKPDLIVSLNNLYPKYSDDDAQTALMYDSAAKMGIAVARNIQDIEANKTAITDGDAATLQAATDHSDAQDAVTLAAANKHSDDNDAITLDAANKYTDGEIAKIPDVEGIVEVEENAVRNLNSVMDLGSPGEFLGGVIQIATLGALPDTPDPNTLYVIRA